jgi:hypothetical protein
MFSLRTGVMRDYTHGSQGHCLGWLQLLSHYHNDPDSNNNCRMPMELHSFFLVSDGAPFINKAVARYR